MNRTAVPDGKKEEDATLYYNVSVESVRPGNNGYSFGFCILTAGKRLDNVSLIEFKATYLFGLRSKNDLLSSQDFETVAKGMIRSTVWPLYRDLTALTFSQAEINLPLLPPTPNKITFDLPNNPQKRASKAKSK
jgi:hypothetical protein